MTLLLPGCPRFFQPNLLALGAQVIVSLLDLLRYQVRCFHDGFIPDYTRRFEKSLLLKLLHPASGELLHHCCMPLNMLQLLLVLDLPPRHLILLRRALGVLLRLLVDLHGDALMAQTVLPDLKELVFLYVLPG